MKGIVKSHFNNALLCSNKAGVVSVKRFSKTKFNIKRFSEDGEVLYDEVAIIPEDEAEATEQMVESIPDDVEVVVASDEDANTDEIMVGVDGGSVDTELLADDGYVEVDTTTETEETTADVE
jgi:hypothetical protein